MQIKKSSFFHITKEVHFKMVPKNPSYIFRKLSYVLDYFSMGNNRNIFNALSQNFYSIFIFYF